jgi:hypothetical protein
VTGSAGLEQEHRRLLAWYPRAFRRDHADEILGVLTLALAWKLSRYFLLLLAVMCYPYAMELAFSPPASSGSDLLGSPTPVHLAALFIPPVLFTLGTVLAAVTPRPSCLLPS